MWQVGDHITGTLLVLPLAAFQEVQNSVCISYLPRSELHVQPIVSQFYCSITTWRMVIWLINWDSDNDYVTCDVCKTGVKNPVIKENDWWEIITWYRVEYYPEYIQVGNFGQKLTKYIYFMQKFTLFISVKHKAEVKKKTWNCERHM
jgi:hypothetical protein